MDEKLNAQAQLHWLRSTGLEMELESMEDHVLYAFKAGWKARDHEVTQLREALEFYATAFDKKLTDSGMGQFTPFLVDRGARAKAALEKK